MKITDQNSRIITLSPLLLCLGMLCFSTLAVVAQTNAPNAGLSPNGSFELEKAQGGKITPEGWAFHGIKNAYVSAYVLDGGAAVHSGTRSVSILSKETTTAGDMGMWITENQFEVTPGATYSVEGWIKTSQCTGKGAWLWVNPYEKKDGAATGSVTFAMPVVFLSGTEDWRECSVQIHIPKNTRWLRIACRLDGPGTAWFDDIKVSKVE